MSTFLTREQFRSALRHYCTIKTCGACVFSSECSFDIDQCCDPDNSFELSSAQLYSLVEVLNDKIDFLNEILAEIRLRYTE